MEDFMFASKDLVVWKGVAQVSYKIFLKQMESCKIQRFVTLGLWNNEVK